MESAQKIASTLKPNLTLKNTVAFTSLLFVLHELHEIAHTAVGRIICGCWGERNFNTWGLCCEGDLTILASIAGPLFTYIMIYIGYYLLSKKYENLPGKKSLGFALVFGSMPFARIFTAMIGGGDELMELEFFLGDYLGDNALWALAIVMVTAILVPALIRAWKSIASSQRLWTFTGFLLLPFIFDVLVVIIGMNKVYQAGVLDQTGLLGSPVIVNLWTLLWVSVLIVTGKELKTLMVPAE
ncbi:hypothetical protein LX73_1052 [Fodinibius salinus]|uniref:Peptidase M50B-like n=1 Tax=Fodinibius salinus TaxID=860790 RepID=A0A5D3YKX9_9BACT|nr:hypothetical protein [Fodinibius salinus]TYP93351.1 hypothetical protein LX73_1052 [Fodinibius salinus]